MKLAELETQFTDKNPALRAILMQFARAFDRHALRATRSKNRDKSPGDTVKFAPKGITSALCSLQFYLDPFLQFKWSRTTLRKLGQEDKLKAILFSQVAPLLSGSRLPEDTDTEFRVVLYASDFGKVDEIIRRLEPFLSTIK